MKKLYRYSDCNWYEEFASADHLILDDYIVKRETNKGFWIVVNGKEKFVLSGKGKRFAHTNIEFALQSYIKRKAMQIRINKNSIKKAKHMLGIAIKLKEQIDSI